MNTSQLKPVIGMEIHVELKTKSKMFCGCPAQHFGVAPNTHTCPVCLGMPGALPVPNRKAIEWTIMIGLGLSCKIAKKSKFDRKHYFYPDLPKGYQISQYDEPFCTQGTIDTSMGRIGITRVHLEEDTAKLQHVAIPSKVEGQTQKVTLVDFNRSSVPLVEIVTDPDITSAKQAREYAQKIHQLVRYLEVSDADMEKGSMRVEANISWGLSLGYKVEVKNINSFRFLEKAIDYELARQKELLEKNIVPNQETRGWSESKNQTYSQRSKEEAEDYRYFPDPDIPPINISQKQLNQIKKNMPELPDHYRRLLSDQWRVRPDYIEIIVANKQYAQSVINCLTKTTALNLNPDEVVNLLVNKNADPTQPELIQSTLAQKTQAVMDPTTLNTIVRQIIADNPDIVAKYMSGKTTVIGALVGQVMRQSKGQADPKTINQLLHQALNTKH